MKARGHNLGDPPQGSRLKEGDIAADLAAYDRLAPRLRTLLKEYPVPFSAVDTLRFQRRLGAAEALRMLRFHLEKYFPGYRAPVAIGPPSGPERRLQRRMRRRA